MKFYPSLGSVVSAPHASVFVVTEKPQSLYAKIGDTIRRFVPLANGQNNIFTYFVATPYSGDSAVIEVYGPNDRLLGAVSYKQRIVPVATNETIKVIAANDYDESSYRIELDKNLEAYVWTRSATWAIPTVVPDLLSTSYSGPIHLVVTRPNVHSDIDESAVECILPMSTSTAFVYLSLARQGEQPGLYARVRRTAAGPANGYIIRSHAASMDKAVGNLRSLMASIHGSSIRSPSRILASPFQGLMFCTWSSIGEHVRLNLENMESLLDGLKGSPISSFLLDDGWQNVRIAKNGTRTLYNFKARNELGSVAQTVQLIKKKLPRVTDVGVWMTLSGYWNGIANSSPLIEKYAMKRYTLSSHMLPGVVKAAEGPTTHSADFKDRTLRHWWIPPPSLAYRFWRDYFGELVAAGVTFVKVDNQAYGEFLEGSDGLQAYIALQDSMGQAAADIFGHGRVLNCMSHSSRLLGGDIAQRLVQSNQQLVARASQDYNRDQSHGMHVIQNLLNGMVFETFNIVADADMFRTVGRGAEMHAILRALMPGPVMLADKTGQQDPEVIRRLVAQTCTGEYRSVHMSRAPRLANAWDAKDTVATISVTDGVGSTIGVFNAGRDKAVHFLPTSFVDNCVFSGSRASWQSVGISTVLDGESATVYTATPTYKLQQAMVACVGLVDKYAALAGVVGVQPVSSTAIRVECSLSGQLGFVVKGDGVVVIEDNSPTTPDVTVHQVSDGSLYTVDLKPYGGANTNWIVTLSIS